MRKILRLAEHLLAGAGLVLITYHLVFHLSVITSPSMAPTLSGTSATNGDWVLEEKLSFKFRQPRRWEVVGFETADGMYVMKRVVGLPGETVSLSGTELLINAEHMPRPSHLTHLRYYPYGNLARNGTIACQEGFYVLGDNSIDSQDSRFEGPISLEQIRGRAWCIVWPLSRLSWVCR